MNAYGVKAGEVIGAVVCSLAAAVGPIVCQRVH